MIAVYCYGAVNIPIAANPTDVVTLSGSSTKTIKILRVGMSASSTLGGTLDATLVKRTSANTGGTFINPVATLYDSTDVPAVATITQYSVNATSLGTGSIIRSQKLLFGASTDPGSAAFEFLQLDPYGFFLRGVNQSLAINFGGLSLFAGSSLDYFIEWREE